MPLIGKTLPAMTPPTATSKKRSGLLGLLKKLKGKVTRENRANDKSERFRPNDQYATADHQSQKTKATGEVSLRNALALPSSNSRSSIEQTSHGDQASFINPAIARGVLQGEAGITGANSEKHLIGSYGAGPCVIVAMYHPETQRAALAHIDACVDPASAIGGLVYLLTSKSGSKEIDVHLASGMLGEANETENKLKQFLSYHQGVVIRSERKTSSLAIDAKNGKVYEGVKFGQLDDGENVDRRLEIRYRVALMAGIGPKQPIEMLFES